MSRADGALYLATGRAQSVAIEYRWAEGRTGHFAEIAAEFVRLRVDVIVTHSTPATIAAMQATSAIPIVFAVAGDPVGSGLVASLARPSSNVTGLSIQQTDTAAKRLELLGEVVPRLRTLAILTDVSSPGSVSQLGELQAAARTLGTEIVTANLRRAEDIGPAFEAIKGRADALYVSAIPLLLTNVIRINTLALGARLPAIYVHSEYVQAGGLMSYGPSYPDLYRRAAELVSKILRGAKPTDLPVEQPTKFDLVVNLTTAKALGLQIPEKFLLRADQVIE